MRALLVVLVLVALGAFQWLRPLPPPKPQAVPLLARTLRARLPAGFRLPWPKEGEAALWVSGVGLLGAHGGERPLPIASLAKMATALVVVGRWPIRPGENGPTFVLDEDAVRTYEKDERSGQSVVPVQAGERLSERALLEALLIPSANNIATFLAEKASGSTRRFVGEMNALARRLGLAHTVYRDPSGVDPGTRSTALDQLRVAQAVMANPVLRRIVAMPQVTLPVAGTVYNVNYALGQEGIVGVKTGSTDQAGGCFAFAAWQDVAGRRRLVEGVVLGQRGPSILLAALGAAKRLIPAAARLPRRFVLVRRGEVLGEERLPWGGTVPLVAARSAVLVGARGLPLRLAFRAKPLAPGSPKGRVAGTFSVTLGEERVTVPLVLGAKLPSPSAWWRLTRV